MHSAFIYSIADYLKSLFYNFLNHYEGSYTKRVLEEALILLGDLWPYLVLGIIATSLIKLYISKNKITEFFQNRKNLSIVLAALIGVISPLGSYIIIPLSAALFLMGTPLPVLISLLMSSPLINPNLFLLTAGAFGYEMAVLRLLSALLLASPPVVSAASLHSGRYRHGMPHLRSHPRPHPTVHSGQSGLFSTFSWGYQSFLSGGTD